MPRLREGLVSFAILSIAAFGAEVGDPQTIPNTITEIRIRLHAVKGITVNGYWVIKIDDGTGLPRDGGGPLESARRAQASSRGA